MWYALGADVDGDGANEVLATAEADEFVSGDPTCENECEYIVHAYVAAVRPGGGALWSFEI